MNNVRKPLKELKGKSNVVGEKINYYRGKAELSAQQLSDKLMMRGLDIHRQGIFNIESGKRTVTDYELCIIADALGITVEMLLDEFIKIIKEEKN